MNTDEITSDLLQNLSDRILLNSSELNIARKRIAALENSRSVPSLGFHTATESGRVSRVERTLLELTDASVEANGADVRIYCDSDKQADELKHRLISMIPIG